MTCPHCGQPFDPFPAFPSAPVEAMLRMMQVDAAVRRAEWQQAAYERMQREQAAIWEEVRRAREMSRAAQAMDAAIEKK